MNLIQIDRIQHGKGEGARHARLPPDLLFDVRIDAGKRTELRVPPGRHTCLHVIEGSVRIEGDDTPATEGDIVWFKPAAGDGEAVMLGLEADTQFRGRVLGAASTAGA